MIAGIILALGAALCGSIGYISIKQGLETTDYRVFILLSAFIGVILSSSLLWSVDVGLAGLNLKAVIPFVVTGGLGGGLLARIALTKAINDVGASRVHALTSVNPLVTALLVVFFLNEEINLQLTIGMLVVVTGASSLSYFIYKNDTKKTPEHRYSNIISLSLAFYGMMMFGFAHVLRKIGLNLGATPLQGSFVRFATGFVLYIAYLLISRTSVKIKLNRQISYYIVASFSWVMTPILSIYALQYISPTVFASLGRVGPLFTVILAYFFLQKIEEITWITAVNSLLIVTGAILVTTS